MKSALRPVKFDEHSGDVVILILLKNSKERSFFDVAFCWPTQEKICTHCAKASNKRIQRGHMSQILYKSSSCAGPGGGGGTGGPDPPEKSRKHRVSYQNWSIFPKNHKATKPTFMLGHDGTSSETPSKWRFTGGPMIARF